VLHCTSLNKKSPLKGYQSRRSFQFAPLRALHIPNAKRAQGERLMAKGFIVVSSQLSVSNYSVFKEYSKLFPIL